MSCEDARVLLETNFMREAAVVSLSANAYIGLIRRSANDNIAGSRTYDAVIAACARKAKVSSLLTFNPNDFNAVTDDSITIIVPGS